MESDVWVCLAMSYVHKRQGCTFIYAGCHKGIQNARQVEVRGKVEKTKEKKKKKK